MSEYLDGRLDPSSRESLRDHVRACGECRRLEEDMRAVISWGKGFPEYAPPAWLSARILARTPRLQRESWVETFAAIAGGLSQRWAASALCASLVCLIWLGGTVGLTPEPADLERPMAVYYRVDRFVGRAYDQAVRFYHRAPIVTEIQARIDQFREFSG